MSRTAIYVTVGSNYSLTIPESPSRGSDWGGTTLPPGTMINPGSTQEVASIGGPGITETNHWGWLYFTVTPTAGGIPFRAQLFVEETHSEVVGASLGYYDSGSSESDPMPGGTFGSVTINDSPPTGQVTYSVS